MNPDTIILGFLGTFRNDLEQVNAYFCYILREKETDSARLGPAGDKGLLADTKTPEDFSEQVIAGEFPGDFAQGPLSEAHLLCE